MTNEYEEKVQKLADIRVLVLTSIVSALALVVGLFWNDAIKAAIDHIVPAGEGLFYKFLAAIIVTAVVVFIIYVFVRSQRIAEEKIKVLRERASMRKQKQ